MSVVTTNRGQTEANSSRDFFGALIEPHGGGHVSSSQSRSCIMTITYAVDAQRAEDSHLQRAWAVGATDLLRLMTFCYESLSTTRNGSGWCVRLTWDRCRTFPQERQVKNFSLGSARWRGRPRHQLPIVLRAEVVFTSASLSRAQLAAVGPSSASLRSTRTTAVLSTSALSGLTQDTSRFAFVSHDVFLS